jgi:glycosyltransferase involved in cell wall biosynthesis
VSPPVSPAVSPPASPPVNPREVHVVVPEGIDDPRCPSGGNTYDRRVCAALSAAGWTVTTRTVTCDLTGVMGATPSGAVAEALVGVPDGAPVLVDALVADESLVPAGRRLRTVVVVHMPTGSDGEARVLRSAAGVIATSAWTRRWLLASYGLGTDRVHVARPGVDRAGAAPGTSEGGRLLCVGRVTREKGHDVLVEALASVVDQCWHCVCVGPLTRDPEFVAGLRRQLRDLGISDRVALTGPLVPSALERLYARADLAVLASRAETYGMVVTEALARGIPVLAADVGGVPEALGTAPDGRRPGLLTPAGDPGALAAALQRWCGDPSLRQSLRDAARARRESLAGWSATADRVAAVLDSVLKRAGR